MVKIDKSKCRYCGLCSNECLNRVFSWDNNENPPKVVNQDYCIQCGRCMAVCSDDAVSVKGIDLGKMKKAENGDLIKKEDLKLLLESKRSWRNYENRPLKREDLHELLDVAQIAPTAMNSQDKSFIVIEDREKILQIREAIIKKSRKFYTLAHVLSNTLLKYLLPREARNFFNRLRVDYEALLESHDNGVDHLFYNAPAIIIFTGVAKDILGKDNALYAMSNFMVMAESMGIGTCINGFTSVNPKALAKIVDIPKHHKVFGVLTAGYKKGKFNKTIYRKPPVVSYI